MRSHAVGSALREHFVEEGGVGLVGGTDDGHGSEGRASEVVAVSCPPRRLSDGAEKSGFGSFIAGALPSRTGR
jgi:hypothetical protein